MGKRSITDEEIGLIKAMLHFGMKNKDIQFYFNRQDRAVNSGRITQIKDGTYGPEVQTSAAAAVEALMASFEAPNIAAAPINVQASAPITLGPLHDQVLSTFFAQNSDNHWVCAVGESEQHECKTSFSLRGFGKPLRAIAGFANNKGGYLFFGVRDKPDGYVVCGLNDDRFESVDISTFSRVIRSSLEPTPDFSVKQIVVGGKKVGVIHVHPHKAKPVIARKTEGDLTEGVIYFRYPGESRAISYPDLRAILDERDRTSRNSILPMVERVLELGPRNALVANLADGTLEGGARPILLDEKLLTQIKFIHEGQFDEKSGAETLRVLGDVSVVPEGSVQPTKTVREEITEDAIIRNFVRSTAVEQPMAYFRQASHEQSWLLPIFYYLFEAGLSPKAAIAALRSHQNAKPKTRDEIVKRLQGKRSLFVKAGGKRSVMLAKVRSKEIGQLLTAAEAKIVCGVLTALEPSDESIFPYVHRLLDSSLKVWEDDPSDRTFFKRIARRRK